MLKPLPIPSEQGLLERNISGQNGLQALPQPTSQVTIDGMVDHMLAAGYTPEHHLKAVTDMQMVNTPQDVIIRVLEIADRKSAESKKLAEKAAAEQATATLRGDRTMKRTSAPVRSMASKEML